MNIGIIGAGQVGGALARVFLALGHRVRIANSRSPDTLSELALKTGATAVWAADAVSGAELLVIAVPERNIPTFPSDIFHDAATDLIVIDTGNYYPERDGAIPEIDDGLPESAWVSQCLEWSVIKAFNNIEPKLLVTFGRAKTPFAKSWRGQPLAVWVDGAVEHEADHGERDHGFGHLGQVLVVA